MHPHKKAASHPNVDVLWQENTWADTTVLVNWVNTTLKPEIENLTKHVLFVGNLTADFKKAVYNLKGVLWYGIKNTTDLWKVVDAGMVQTLKVLTKHNYQKWLDNVDI